jgi:serine/threonine protein kinase
MIIADYKEGGDLCSLLDKVKKLSENDARFYLAETILALEHLHEVGTLSPLHQ